jgi:hypothetical protein
MRLADLRMHQVPGVKGLLTPKAPQLKDVSFS